MGGSIGGCNLCSAVGTMVTVGVGTDRGTVDVWVEEG